MLLFATVYGLLVLSGVDVVQLLPRETEITDSAIFRAVVFAPVVETLMLAGGIALLSRATQRKGLVVTVSALAWGSLHALFGVLWFFGTVWSFFVFSCAFLAWRKVSFRHGFIAASVPHALVNISALCLSVVNA
jgi:Type II CAAX prenyl endopeptidase Rce1-like